jgi:hypothetical protein
MSSDSKRLVDAQSAASDASPCVIIPWGRARRACDMRQRGGCPGGDVWGQAGSQRRRTMQKENLDALASLGAFSKAWGNIAVSEPWAMRRN